MSISAGSGVAFLPVLLQIHQLLFYVQCRQSGGGRFRPALAYQRANGRLEKVGGKKMC